MNESDQLRVACPSCGKRLRVKPALQGKRLKCPSCAKAFEARPDEEGAEQYEDRQARQGQGKRKEQEGHPQAKTVPWAIIGAGNVAVILSGLFIFLWLGAKSERRNLKDQLAAAETKIQQAASLADDLKKQLAAAKTNPGDPKTPVQTPDPLQKDPKTGPQNRPPNRRDKQKRYDEQFSGLMKKLWSAQGKDASSAKMLESLIRASSTVRKQGGALVAFHLSGKAPTVWGGGKRGPDRTLTALFGRELSVSPFDKSFPEKVLLDSIGKPDKTFKGGNLTIFVGGAAQDSTRTPDHSSYLDGIIVFLCKDGQVQDVAIDIARLGLGQSSKTEKVEFTPGRYQLDWMGEGTFMMYRGRDDEVGVFKKGDSYFVKIAGDKYFGGITSELNGTDIFVSRFNKLV